MSFSIADRSSIPIPRKQTATECLMENGDPLVANKKAREAAKKGLQPEKQQKKKTVSFILLVTGTN
jgi:hypothetical protein